MKVKEEVGGKLRMGYVGKVIKKSANKRVILPSLSTAREHSEQVLPLVGNLR